MCFGDFMCNSHCHFKFQADVVRKIGNAFCPPAVLEGNPCVDYVRHIVFGKYSEFEVLSNGVSTKFVSCESFESAYVSGAITAEDLKVALAASINSMLEPVRQHFQNDARAKAILEDVRSFKVTR